MGCKQHTLVVTKQNKIKTKPTKPKTPKQNKIPPIISPISFTLSLVHLHQKSSESAAKFQTYIASMEKILLHMPVMWKRIEIDWWSSLRRMLIGTYLQSFPLDTSFLSEWIYLWAHFLRMSLQMQTHTCSTCLLVSPQCCPPPPPMRSLTPASSWAGHLSLQATVTLHIADPSLWEPLHHPSHKEFTSKMFCTDRCSVFQETDFIRSELQPLYSNSNQTMER